MESLMLMEGKQSSFVGKALRWVLCFYPRTLRWLLRKYDENPTLCGVLFSSIPMVTIFLLDLISGFFFGPPNFTGIVLLLLFAPYMFAFIVYVWIKFSCSVWKKFREKSRS